MKLSRWFANGIRSWPFLVLFVGWTALWWGWLGRRLGDPSPYLQWSLYTTFLTELDLIVYGIYQRRQGNDDTMMQRNQLDTMRLLVEIAKEIRGEQTDQEKILDEIQDRMEKIAPPSPLVQETPSEGT